MSKQQANIVVLGGGESGVGAALLAWRRGFSVFVSDRGTIAPKYVEELERAGIPYESGRHTEEKIFAAAEVIKSPGIPDQVPLVRALVAKGIPVIGEIEFAARYTRSTLVAITGSNGKTTTATLTHHLLNEAGFDSRLVGNVGRSFARSLVEDEAAAIYVLEISSFQLDSTVSFRPHYAALLNITPDHLDRYDYELDNYIASKFRIAGNQQAEDLFVYFADDENIRKGLARHPVAAQRAAISFGDIDDRFIHLGDQRFDLSTTRLTGRHNAVNALFACRLALAVGASAADIQRGLDSFTPVPHRLELVGKIDGVDYINDSKATNVDAVFYALEAMRQPTIWIAGGQDKGNDYAPLLPLVRDKVKALVCLGVDNGKLKTAFGEVVPTLVETTSAEAAVAAAVELADAGDVVLLSPACASFDLFKNYLDRGDQFREAVQKRMRGQGGS